MENRFPKPVIFASRCLGFAKCRYNGITMPSPFIDALGPFVEFVTTCAEVDIGLGIPRPTVRLVQNGSEIQLIQPKTGRDCTDDMKGRAEKYFDEIGVLDGCVFKSRSPSCGIKDVKIYKNAEKGAAVSKGVGLFAERAFEKFPLIAIEDEGRLTDFNIRNYFYTHIFTRAKFREVKKRGTVHDLMEFHARNKYLFMTYNQSKMREMGKTVANHEKRSLDEVFFRYEELLGELFAKNARFTSHINTMQHIFGYFSKDLDQGEKAFFADYLEKYRNHKVPLLSILVLLKAWAVRFNDEYLLKQSYFEPYPEELFSVRDSGKECSRQERR